MIVTEVEADDAVLLARWVSGRNALEDAGFVQGNLGVIAKDNVGHVIDQTRIDHIVSVTTKDDIAGKPCAYHVIAAKFGVDGHEITQECIPLRQRVDKVDIAVVTQNNVLAVFSGEATRIIGDDYIIRGTAKDDVVAQTRGDDVIAADGGALGCYAEYGHR